MGSLVINPIAFSIGPISVYWYGLILGTGALVGLLLAIREGKRFGIPQEFFMDLLLLGVPSAIIAARIYYVAFKWDEYKHNLWDIFKIWEGGIAIYGALIGAIICAVFFVKRRGYDFWRIADICAPSLIAGQMIGRWGNFVNQEAYGGVTTESFLADYLHLPSFIVDQMFIHGEFRHPTFLYESVWNLLGLFLLFVLRRRKFLRAGELFLTYFVWYSIGRFFIEALRTDSLAFQGAGWLASLLYALWKPMEWAGFEQGFLDPSYGNVRISQFLALLIVVVAIVFILTRRKMTTDLPRYLDPIVSRKNNLIMASDKGTGESDQGAGPNGTNAKPAVSQTPSSKAATPNSKLAPDDEK